MNKNILERIIDAQREFQKQHQRSPTVLRITPDDESKLAKLTFNEIGNLTEKIVYHGVRKALPQLFGMRVEYDAKSFSLE